MDITVCDKCGGRVYSGSHRAELQPLGRELGLTMATLEVQAFNGTNWMPVDVCSKCAGVIAQELAARLGEVAMTEPAQ